VPPDRGCLQTRAEHRGHPSGHMRLVEALRWLGDHLGDPWDDGLPGIVAGLGFRPGLRGHEFIEMGIEGRPDRGLVGLINFSRGPEWVISVMRIDPRCLSGLSAISGVNSVRNSSRGSARTCSFTASRASRDLVGRG